MEDAPKDWEFDSRPDVYALREQLHEQLISSKEFADAIIALWKDAYGDS